MLRALVRHRPPAPALVCHSSAARPPEMPPEEIHYADEYHEYEIELRREYGEALEVAARDDERVYGYPEEQPQLPVLGRDYYPGSDIYEYYQEYRGNEEEQDYILEYVSCERRAGVSRHAKYFPEQHLADVYGHV